MNIESESEEMEDEQEDESVPEYDVSLETEATVSPHRPEQYDEGELIDTWKLEAHDESTTVSYDYIEENTDLEQSSFETEMPVRELFESNVDSGEWHGDEAVAIDVYGDPSRQTISRIEFHDDITQELAEMIGLIVR